MGLITHFSLKSVSAIIWPIIFTDPDDIVFIRRRIKNRPKINSLLKITIS